MVTDRICFPLVLHKFITSLTIITFISFFLIISSFFLSIIHFLPNRALPHLSQSHNSSCQSLNSSRWHHSSRPPHSMGPPVSWGLNASSLTEARPGSTLLYVSLGCHGVCCMVGGTVSERSQRFSSVETYSLPMSPHSSSASISFFPSQLEGSPASVHWLGAIICIFQLIVEPLHRSRMSNSQIHFE